MLVRSRVVRLLVCCSTATVTGVLLAACGSSGGGDGPMPRAASSGAKRQASVKASRTTPKKVKCARARTPTPRGAQRIPKPGARLDPAKRYVVSLTTNCGTIEIQLDVRDAPRTTASFAYLVRRGFYDDLTFHRIAAGFVIQGGDPNGDGSGGPGYRIVEPPPSDVRYTLGTVAMAKTGTDPAGTSGSQFFIVTAHQAPLPAQYALVGNVVGSLAGVEAIAKLPTDPPGDGAPKTPVVIDRATLSSS